MTPRAAQVRIYVDADVLGLGKILASLGNDVTYPGDPGAVIHKRQRASCPITSPDVLDTDWIPQVAARGWLIVTRDAMITQNRNEITAVRENNAKMVALNQRDAQTKWGQLEVFMTQRRRIEALTAEPGPFIWRTSRTAMTPIPPVRYDPTSASRPAAESLPTTCAHRCDRRGSSPNTDQPFRCGVSAVLARRSGDRVSVVLTGPSQPGDA